MIPAFITISSLTLLCFVSCSSQSPRIASNNANTKTELNKNNGKVSVNSKMIVRFKNKMGEMEYILDPTDEDIAVSMTGKPQEAPIAPPPEKESRAELLPRLSQKDTIYLTEKHEKENKEVKDSVPVPNANNIAGVNNDEVLRKVVGEIRQAQEFFYAKNYENALASCEKANSMRETAESYSLMGSIFFVNGQKDQALKSWIKALNLNPDLPSVQKMVKKLKGES